MHIGRFRSFGPLRYARITLDNATGRSRGTGFVCFWNKEDADRAIQQAELLLAETGGTQVSNVIPNLHQFLNNPSLLELLQKTLSKFLQF